MSLCDGGPLASFVPRELRFTIADMGAPFGRAGE